MVLKKQSASGHPRGMIDFTEDMVANLQKYFSLFEVNGVVTIEANDKGLWFVNHTLNSRQFLGKARFGDCDYKETFH